METHEHVSSGQGAADKVRRIWNAVNIGSGMIAIACVYELVVRRRTIEATEFLDTIFGSMLGIGAFIVIAAIIVAAPRKN